MNIENIYLLSLLIIASIGPAISGLHPKEDSSDFGVEDPTIARCPGDSQRARAEMRILLESDDSFMIGFRASVGLSGVTAPEVELVVDGALCAHMRDNMRGSFADPDWKYVFYTYPDGGRLLVVRMPRHELEVIEENGVIILDGILGGSGVSVYDSSMQFLGGVLL